MILRSIRYSIHKISIYNTDMKHCVYHVQLFQNVMIVLNKNKLTICNGSLKRITITT